MGPDPELTKGPSPSADGGGGVVEDSDAAASSPRRAQLKGMGYEEGAAALAPPGAVPASSPAAAPPVTPAPEAAPAPAAPTGPLTNLRFAGDAELEKIAAGKRTMRKGASGGAVRKVQAALESLGLPLDKYHADGKFGDVTLEGVTLFQAQHGVSAKKAGVVDEATIRRLDEVTPQADASRHAWSEGEFNTADTLARPKLSNPRFVGDPVLELIMSGLGAIIPGAAGPHVLKVQEALGDLGFKPETDGKVGSGTKDAIKNFQAAFNVPLKPTKKDVSTMAGYEKQGGVLNPTTLACLDAYAPAKAPTPPPAPAEGDAAAAPATGPDYKKLFEDGKFDITVAFGFDDSELAAHLAKKAPFVQYMTSELGFAMTDPQVATAAELASAGLDATTADRDMLYFNRTIDSKAVGKKVDVQVKLLAASEKGDDGAAKLDKYKAALETDDAILYTGHARAGTGPDFDPHSSSAGNYVMGKGYKSSYNKEIKGADNQLDATNFTDKYQLLQFWGCSTKNYEPHLDKHLGKRSEGGVRATKDIVLTKDPIYSNRGVLGVLTLLRGLLAEASGDTLATLLNTADRSKKAKLDGFDK